MLLRIFTGGGIDPVGNEGRVKIGMETVEQGVSIGTDGTDGLEHGIAEQAAHQRRECLEQELGERFFLVIFIHDQYIGTADRICARGILSPFQIGREVSKLLLNGSQIVC